MAVGTLHRIVNVLISLILGAGVMTTAIIALTEAPGTPYDNGRWEGITISAVTITALQMLSNFPYILVSKRNRYKPSGKYTDMMWKGVHLFASLVSTTLFFLTFYLDELRSADLRTNFWTQFKFEVDPKYSKAYIEVLVVFTDLIGLNAVFTLGIVAYPKVSRLWNRSGPDIPIEISSARG